MMTLLEEFPSRPGLAKYLFIVNVDAVVVRGDQYLLIVRGKDEPHAPGTLSFPGGKVEASSNGAGLFEEAVRREVWEETGIQVRPEMVYVESRAFVTDDGVPAIGVVFLCEYQDGTPTVSDPGEVEAVQWMTFDEVMQNPDTPPWTMSSLLAAERVRKRYENPCP